MTRSCARCRWCWPRRRIWSLVKLAADRSCVCDGSRAGYLDLCAAAAAVSQGLDRRGCEALIDFSNPRGRYADYKAAGRRPIGACGIISLPASSFHSLVLFLCASLRIHSPGEEAFGMEKERQVMGTHGSYRERRYAF